MSVAAIVTAAGLFSAGRPAAAEMSASGKRLHRLTVFSTAGGLSATPVTSSKKARFTFGDLSTGTATSANYRLQAGFQRIRYYPGTVSDASAGAANGKGKIDLTWTAPGSDGALGDVDSYLIKYASYAITSNALFDAATTYSQSFNPATPGATETRTLTGFTSGETYFFAIKASQGEHVSYLGNSDSQSAPASGNPSTVEIATSAPLMDGAVRVTTVTVVLTDADGNRASGFGVDFEAYQSSASISYSPDASDPSFGATSDSTGTAVIVVREDLASVDPDVYSAFGSTLTLRVQNLGSQTLALAEGRVASVSVSSSTPVYEGLVRVTTFTVALADVGAGAVSDVPVSLEVEASPAIVTVIPDASGFSTATAGSGSVQFQVREDLSTVPIAQLSTYASTTSVKVLGFADTEAVLREDRVASFTVTISTNLRSDLRVVTATVTLLDGGGAPVPDVPVAISTYTPFTVSSQNRVVVSSAGAVVSADGSGQAAFDIALTDTELNDFDDYDDFTATATFVALGQAALQKGFLVESNKLDHFRIESSSRVAVGVEFPMAVYADNRHHHNVPNYTGAVSLASRIAGSNVQSLGSLAITQGTLNAGVLSIANQTYNNVENIEIRAFRLSDGKSGRSSSIAITGPSQFEVTLPTQTLANANFTMTIRALDENGAQVIGYAGTLSLSAVLASDTGQPGTGSLGVTAIGFPSNGTLTMESQSYTRGETIRIKVEDTAQGVSSLSPPIQFTLVASNIDHFEVVAPTASPVGVAFSMTIVAVDASSSPVSDPVNTRIDLAPLLFGTEVSGSGNLSVRSVVIPINSTHVVIPSQSYNRIETIEIKAQDDFGKLGRSGQVRIKGPSVLQVSVPTSTVRAGESFRVIVVAVDDEGQVVSGYNGTISLSAVDPSTTTQAAGGVLGLTNLQVVAGVGVTEFESYTKAETIRIRALDSAINAVGVSSALVVGIGPPARVDLAANPGSIIQGEVAQLVATVFDSFGNEVPGSTVTFTVTQGSGTVARDLVGLADNLTSTTAVSNAEGDAVVLFGLPSGLSEAQTNLAQASIGPLTDGTTIFVSVLIPSGNGGVVVQSGDPRTKVTIPPNAYPFDVSVSIKEGDDIPDSAASKAAAAFAKQTGQFISEFLKQVQVSRGNSSADAGAANVAVTLQFPFDVVSSTQVEVSGLAAAAASVGPMVSVQSVLVPASVLRIYRLNQTDSLWEQVSEGTFLNLSSSVVTASVRSPTGLYALGTPPFADVSPTQSANLQATLGTGATVQVQVPAGAFETTVRVTVDAVAPSRLTPPGGGAAGLKATGLAVEIVASGLQPKKQLQLSIQYTNAQIAGFDEALLRLARFDETLKAWVLLESQVDARAKRILGFTDHLSVFQVMQVQPQATLTNAFVRPNPFRPSQGHPDVRITGMTAGATVRIFTVTGRFVRRLTADGAGEAAWDVKDSDGNAAPSGVYLALVESGGEKRTLKVAVQR